MTWEQCLRCRLYRRTYNKEGKVYKTCFHEKYRGRLRLWEIKTCPKIEEREKKSKENNNGND